MTLYITLKKIVSQCNKCVLADK